MGKCKKAAAALLTLIISSANFVPATGQSFAVDKVKGSARHYERFQHARRPVAVPVEPAAAAALAPAPMRLPGSNTVLCAVKVWDDRWKDESYPLDAGVYTVEAKPSGRITKVKENRDMMMTLSGVKIGSTFYTISYDTEYRYFYSAYSTSTWYRTQEPQEIDIQNAALDLTYNPKTGKTYGIFDSEEYGHTNIGEFSTYSAEATVLYETERDCFAMACNAAGEMYGIMGYTGWLVRLYPDKASSPNGAGFEYIGKSGFTPTRAEGYCNTMTFDDATGKLYWLATGPAESALIELNTETGAGTVVRTMEHNESWAGAYAMPYKVPDAAPGAVTGLRVDFTAPAALTATLQATAPTRTANNATLSGPLTVAFRVNGAIVAEVEGVEPGAVARTAQLTLPEGLLTIEALAATADSEGDPVTITSWGGEDTPGPVTALTLSDAGGAPHLSWQAPVAGEHGGYFSSEGLSYTIVRMPDRHTVSGITATEWTDAIPSGVAAYHYEVSAVNARGSSPAVASAKMNFGAGFDVPWLEQFNTRADFDLWTVVDLNGSTTWEYSVANGNISYNYSTSVEREADDWIFSPRIRLKAGVTYALTYDAKSYYAGYTENFRFMLGRDASPEAMTALLTDVPDFDVPAGRTDRVLFSVEADGAYHLGLYCYSPAHNWTLTIDNIGITEVIPKFPAKISDLTVTPGAAGELKADIAMTVPTLLADGSAMRTVANVSLYRGGFTTPVKTWSGVAPGARLSWTDATITAPGRYTYKAVATNSDGDSQPAEASAWVGTDLPGPVTDLKLRENADGSVTLTWQPPVAGANGGYFDPAGITYRVMRSIDATQIADGLTATTFTDRTLSLTRQELCYYLVWPVKDGERGTYANTPLNLVLGPALTAPVRETFPAADYTLYPWTSESDGSVYLWSLEYGGINPPCDDQNGDRGLAMFISTAANAGLTGSLTSPKISLAALAAPELSFWMYHSAADDAAKAEEMTVGVSAGHGAPVEAMRVARDAAAGWRRYTVDLSRWRSEPFVQIVFAAKSLGGASMYIDNIAVGERREIDAELTAVDGPSRLGTGIAASYTAIVSNLGSADLRGVAVSATFGGKAVAEPVSVDIPAGSAATVTLAVTAPVTASRGELTVTATAAGDAEPANDALARPLAVVDALRGVPSQLSAATSGAEVALAWLDATATPMATDDAESYTDFAINGIGDYITYDADFGYTCYINKDLDEYPNQNAPKAFQVLNARRLGIDIWDEGTPHSGDRMLAALAPLDCANDDWLISPLLNGSAHTVSFYAKAFTNQDGTRELMRVLWSDGSTAPADFTPLHDADVIEVPDSWTEYRYALPAGARRFAINCVSLQDEGFALFIDDLAYNDLTVSPDAPTGYEVERDGATVATVTAASATDRPVADGTYSYRVRAMWPDGPGAYTDPVEVTLTGAGITDAGTDRIGVSAGRGTVTVTGAAGRHVCAALADGRIIYSGTAPADSLTFAAPSGAVVVSVGTTARLAIVR